MSNAYDEMIIAAAVNYDVPPPLIKAVIATESGFDPDAYREEKLADGTVWDASYGLMQLLFRTAVSLGFPNDRAQYLRLLEPQVNIDLGTKLLKQLIGRYGMNPPDIYAAYNSGAVRKNAAGQYVNTKGSTAVQTRVDRFMRFYAQYAREWEATRTGPAPGSGGAIETGVVETLVIVGVLGLLAWKLWGS